MTDLNMPSHAPEVSTPVESHDLSRRIDDLMAQPPKGRPAITVVGDEHVFAIYPPTS